RNQQPAIFDELLQLLQAIPANSARNVVGFRRSAQARRSRRLLERHWPPGFRQALDLFGKFQVDVPVDENVDTIAQPSGTDILVPNVNVWHVALVEAVANPSDGIRIRPGHPNTKARRLCSVMWDIRHCQMSAEGQAQSSTSACDGLL